MTDADILTILKTDLMVSSSALDTYLQTLIASAKDYISTEGITLADSQSDGMLIEMYAAYLYRRRREENVQMPRMLRWALNNRLFSEKGAVNALTGPIERGDAQTVSKHLQEIRKFAAESTVGQDILTAYTALSKQLIRIAQQKHPQKDYKHLEKELEQ